MEEINYKALRKKLRLGDMTKISKMVNLSTQAVSQQFSGKAKITDDVVTAALSIVNARETKSREFNEQIKNL